MGRLIWRGPEVKGKYKDAAADALYEAAEHILEESNRVVPIEEGTLGRSGFAEVDRGRLVAHVGYDTPYAVRQHEELDWRHDEGRKAKYLEDTANEQAQAVNEHIARRLKGVR